MNDMLLTLQRFAGKTGPRALNKCKRAGCASASARLFSLASAVVLSLFGGGTASAAPENTADIGGAGKFTVGITCFESGSKKVPIVCGEQVVVHYKVTALMGDPLGNYGVSWKVFSFHIADADEKRSENYFAGSVPAAIWNARESVELTLYGGAWVKASIGSRNEAALQFDTGFGVKATGEVSLNIPSGYNWDRFLVVPNGSPCREDSRPAEPQDARKLMRSGFELQYLQICPRTSVNVDGLERAISNWCESRADNRPKYCLPKDKEDEARQKKPTTDPFAALDRPAARAVAESASNDPFAVLDGGQTPGGKAAPFDLDGALDKAEAVRVAAVERKRLYEATRASCEQDLARQEVCSKDTCGTEPPTQVCVREIKFYPPSTCSSGSCLVFPQYRCEEQGQNPAHTTWKNCLRDTAAQCAALGKRITSVSSCVSERMANRK